MTFTTAAFDEAAHGGLKPSPTGRLRRVLLHLSYSMALSHLLDTTPPALFTRWQLSRPRAIPDLVRAFWALLNWGASSAHQPRQQHYDKDDHEDEKQYLCNACSSERDSTKAQKPGDDCDYEKHQRPIEHTLLR